MDPDDAWLAITKITNKDRVTKKDIEKARELKQHLRPDERLWLEEALFLMEQRR